MLFEFLGNYWQHYQSFNNNDKIWQYKRLYISFIISKIPTYYSLQFNSGNNFQTFKFFDY